MATVLYGPQPQPILGEGICLSPPPEYECVPNDPCEEVKCCPPRTKVRDALRVYNNEAQRCFKINGQGCKRPALPMTGVCVVMFVRRRGECRVLMQQAPTNLNVDGDVCFRWTPEFLNLPEGYYEGELQINGKKCNVVGFYFPPCTGRPTSTQVEYSECSTANPSCALEVDQSPVEPNTQGCTSC
jgi:hypothetical protein